MGLKRTRYLLLCVLVSLPIAPPFFVAIPEFLFSSFSGCRVARRTFSLPCLFVCAALSYIRGFFSFCEFKIRCCGGEHAFENVYEVQKKDWTDNCQNVCVRRQCHNGGTLKPGIFFDPRITITQYRCSETQKKSDCN